MLDRSIGNITKFQTDRPEKPAYGGIGGTTISRITAGKRMQLNAGQFYDINIAISEAPDGIFSAFLMFEEKESTYEKSPTPPPFSPFSA